MIFHPYRENCKLSISRSFLMNLKSHAKCTKQAGTVCLMYLDIGKVGILHICLRSSVSRTNGINIARILYQPCLECCTLDILSTFQKCSRSRTSCIWPCSIEFLSSLGTCMADSFHIFQKSLKSDLPHMIQVYIIRWRNLGKYMVCSPRISHENSTPNMQCTLSLILCMKCRPQRRTAYHLSISSIEHLL